MVMKNRRRSRRSTLADMDDVVGLSLDIHRDHRSRTLSRRPEKRRHARTGSQDAREAVTEHTRDKTPDSTKSVVAKTTHMRSAQALSFWSISFITVADLVCALATILAVAIIILSLSMIVGNVLSIRSTQVFVSGNFGHVQGLTERVLGHTEVYAFLGLPYAHPPLAELRFRNTFIDYKATLTKSFVIDGTQAGPACVQRAPDDSSAAMSEDCLHLNIWTTSLDCRSPACADKAVLVFLHDGSFQTGSNRQPIYDGRYLSALGDVVVVVPNYRLGALGFLSDGTDDAPGNVGLHDQLLALEWTRHNIARFGGNASNVVLVGYGAGAAAAGYLLFSEAAGVPAAHRVPRRAILMSGGPFTKYPDNTKLRLRHAAEQAKLLHCLKGPDPDIKCLREVEASLFVKTATPPKFFPSFSGLIPFPPQEMALKDEVRISGVQVLLGHMDDETVHATQLVRSILDLSDNLKKAIVDLFDTVGLNSSATDVVVQKYTKETSDELEEAFYEIAADLLVTCPVRDMSRLLVSVAGNRVFRYVISSAIAGPAASSDDMLQLLFGVPFRRPLQHDAMRVTSQLVISHWTHFARTGQVPDFTELVYGRYTFSVARAGEVNGDFLGTRNEYCDFLKRTIT